MTRISRISAPRATLAAWVLLVIVVLGFGILAQQDGDSIMAAREVQLEGDAGGEQPTIFDSANRSLDLMGKLLPRVSPIKETR